MLNPQFHPHDPRYTFNDIPQLVNKRYQILASLVKSKSVSIFGEKNTKRGSLFFDLYFYILLDAQKIIENSCEL